MQHITDQVNSIARRLRAFSDILILDSDIDTWELVDMSYELDDIEAQLSEVKDGVKAGEVSAICLWCSSRFYHSQGHACTSLTTYYDQKTD